MRGILTYQEMKVFVERGEIIIDADLENIKSCNYDIRLGPEYFIKSKQGFVDRLRNRLARSTQIEINQFQDQRVQTMIIPANEMAFVESYEKLNLPKDIVGHVSLKLDLISRGLLLASQTPIEPGYKGRIFCMLYNLSDNCIEIQYRKAFLTLELHRMESETEKPYHGYHQNFYSLAQFVVRNTGSALSKLEEDVSRSIATIKTITIAAGLTYLVAVLALTIPLRDKANRSEYDIQEKVLPSLEYLEIRANKLENAIDSSFIELDSKMSDEIDSLKAQLEGLQGKR